VVAALGDTAMTYDPVGGQGANSGNKMARHMVERAVAHGDRPFDEAWITETFERFYERHGRHLDAFNSTFLDPTPLGARLIMMSQHGSDGIRETWQQRLADAFTNNFNDPAELTETMLDAEKARAFIARTTGLPWWAALARGGFSVAAGQVRQRLGRA
jgi:hypothetical protein